ncbi:MAG: D-alanyl-D-alanine carboxypeptidase family protein [Rhodospirillales bacterium]
MDWKPALFGAALIAAMSGGPALAQEQDTSGNHAILIEAATGDILFAKDAETPMAPASMSKLMTLYMVFERLRDGRLSLDDTFNVSRNAWQKGGTKSGSSTMFLEPDSKVTVSDLIHGIIIQSGNDACIVVAEGLAESEEAFAAAMTKKARELGLNHSTFANSTGWPDPDHLMSAEDLAKLALILIKEFPDYYPIFAETSFVHNGIKQSNRNPLLYEMEGADGLKTGHTQDSGYGLTASAVRDGRRLILVVNGLASRKARAQESERLMQWGFREFGLYPLFSAGEEVDQAAVWLGEAASVPLIIPDAVTLALPKLARQNMTVTVKYSGPLEAPITAGETVGKVEVSAPGQDVRSFPLVAGADVAQLGLWGRVNAAVRHILFGSSG